MVFFLWASIITNYFLSKKFASINFLIFPFLLFGLFLLEEDFLSMYSESKMLKFSLCFLTVWIFFLMSLTLKQSIFKSKKKLEIWGMLLMMILTVTFSMEKYFSFYFWFELSVFPIFLMIIMGGGSKFRLEAGFFIILFTISSALLLFFSIFLLSGSGEVSIQSEFFNGGATPHGEGGGEGKFYEILIFILISITFLIKFPVFFFHMWLPKAHVEAPVMGSMVLAGILLKLGGMGFFIFKKFLSISFWEGQLTLMIFFLLGSIFMGLVCFKQEDMKVLIAYSSVNHMAIVIFSMMVGGSFSLIGGILLMVGHGLVSSLLFFLSSQPYNFNSNRVLLTMGQTTATNWSSLIWLMGVLINMGFPPFISFFGEILILSHSLSILTLLLVFFMNFLVIALYSFSLLSNIILKKKNYFLSKEGETSGVFISHLVSFLHLWPMLWFMNFFFFF